MGSFINQPDFAVRAKMVMPSDDLTPANFLNKAAIYVGNGANDKDLTVVMSDPETGGPTTITFSGVQTGTFLPICVDYVLESDTTVTKIVAYW
jgi:hypothetical protein